MRKWKATEEQVAQVLAERAKAAPKAPEEVEVWPENWDLWLFFLAVQTQWEYASGGLSGAVKVAMNWTGVRSIAAMRRVSDEDQQRFADGLAVIEQAVLDVERERAARQAASAHNTGRRR
nr:DUF1799 domain-containing protein [uncultured Acidovorax sp.]